jgi:hypothetical protein
MVVVTLENNGAWPGMLCVKSIGLSSAACSQVKYVLETNLLETCSKWKREIKL